MKKKRINDIQFVKRSEIKQQQLAVEIVAVSVAAAVRNRGRGRGRVRGHRQRCVENRKKNVLTKRETDPATKRTCVVRPLFLSVGNPFLFCVGLFSRFFAVWETHSFYVRDCSRAFLLCGKPSPFLCGIDCSRAFLLCGKPSPFFVWNCFHLFSAWETTSVLVCGCWSSAAIAADQSSDQC